MNKSSILFIIQLPPPVHGAALRNEFLAKSTLLNNTYDIEVMRLDFAKSVSDISKFSLLKLCKMGLFAVRLCWKLCMRKYNMVYYNFAVRGIALYRDWLFVCIIKLFNIPVALHIRTQGVKEQAAKSGIKQYMLKSALKGTSVICLSNKLASDVETVYGGTPFIVANGIDLVVQDAQVMDKPINIIPNLLFLSNLTRSKGIFEFIDALKILKDQKHRFNAKIVGPEYDITITDLEQYLADRDLQHQVKIEGPVYGDAKFQHFLESDVFVFPTWFEAFPGVVLEAMQSAVPIVSTHEGAIPEIVGDGVTGYLVPQKDVEALAEKLEYLLKNRSLRNKMGQAARQRFLDEFTSSIFEQKMNEVFVKAMTS